MIRIFANALSRRIAYVLVALVLGWFGLTGRAHAQANPNACPKGGTCTQAQAWQACQAWMAHYMATAYFDEYRDPSRNRCHLPSSEAAYIHQVLNNSGVWGNTYVFYFVTECPAGWFDPETGACEEPCADKPPIPGSERHALGPESSFCYEGCFYTGRGSCLGIVIDGIESTYCSYWTTEPGATCSVGESPEPIPAPVDSDGDGISDENDLSPNNPGVGDATGQEPSRACGGPGQPECLPDGSNEGSGRGNTSSGGGDCNTPPRSSGDAILAQIAFQTWATRCAIVGAANEVPGSGSGGGDGDGDGGDGSEMDKLRNEAAGLDASLGEGDAEAAWIEAPSGLDLDTGGLGIGGTCPAPPTINGVSIDPDNNLCMLVQIIGSLVLVGAFAHAGYIIGRA